MRSKYIKSAFLLVLVFCTCFAMASQGGSGLRATAGDIKLDKTAGFNGEPSVSQPFILHQVSHLVKPANRAAASLTALAPSPLVLKGFDESGYAYSPSDDHFKAFYKLLLFPFHGFW